MSSETVKEFYDRQYRNYSSGDGGCSTALHDIAKATRRVVGVLGGFGIEHVTRGAAVLDVGCGLGYYTKALASTGASVTGVDFSDAAIESARAAFPDCRFIQGTWPDDVADEPSYDLIWMVNFSLLNTFDVDQVHVRLVNDAMRRLKPGGCLVVGWNSNLSGKVVDGYSHWSSSMLRTLRTGCGLSAPLVPEARTLWLSWFLMRVASVKGQSVPIFLMRRKC